MSAAPRIFEGTWEEIKLHSAELAGHRLKVTIVDAPEQDYRNHPAFDTSPEAIRAWTERVQKWAYDRPPIGPFNDSRDAIYEDYLK